MKIGIVGASGAGLYVALMLSLSHPYDQIDLIDQKSVLGKKLLATGNGHCNLLPSKLDCSAFRNEDETKKFFGKTSLNELKSWLFDLGIMLKEVNGLYYPECYHAPTFVSYLEGRLRENKVNLLLNTTVFDYRKHGDGYILSTSAGDLEYDRLIMSFGGKSHPSLGSDGSIFNIIKNHGYQVNAMHPGLTPLKTKESTSKLDGIRHEARLIIQFNGGQYIENGEILFKKNGLSGICVFNASSCWVRAGKKEASIEIDLFPNLSEEELTETLTGLMKRVGSSYLKSVFPKPLEEYIRFGASRMYGDDTPFSVAKAAKKMVFHPIDTYGFEDSQVTIGGISLDEIDHSFGSKREKGVYFIGECLDNDGLCGGNNLAWCLLGAKIVSDSI